MSSLWESHGMGCDSRHLYFPWDSRHVIAISEIEWECQNDTELSYLDRTQTHALNLLKIDSVIKSPQYGSVRFQNKTYNQQYFPQGRHYNFIQKFDQHCTCPFLRQIIWNAALQWTTLKFGEALHKNNSFEILKSKTLRHTRHKFWNAYIKNSLTDRKINAIEIILKNFLRDKQTIYKFISNKTGSRKTCSNSSGHIIQQTPWEPVYGIFVLGFRPKKQQFSVALPTP